MFHNQVKFPNFCVCNKVVGFFLIAFFVLVFKTQVLFFLEKVRN